MFDIKWEVENAGTAGLELSARLAIWELRSWPADQGMEGVGEPEVVGWA